jgi:FkbM family methyltransferase
MNVDLIKRKFWNVVRPLHSPLTKAARRRLGRNYSDHPEMELPAAYEAIQLEVERRLHDYLHVQAERIRQIVIVGANEASEIWRLRRSCPSSRFLCFEPSPAWYKELVNNFRDLDFVETRELALSDSVGTATFYELPLVGNGSLLSPNRDRWSAFCKIEKNDIRSFQVQVSTLDKETTGLNKIDLLWVDVQGAEGNVLQGGPNTLDRASAVFLEIALVDSPYEGALLFPELNRLLHDFGFLCVGLGLDGWNYTGNAFWIRDLERRLLS